MKVTSKKVHRDLAAKKVCAFFRKIQDPEGRYFTPGPGVVTAFSRLSRIADTMGFQDSG